MKQAEQVAERYMLIDTTNGPHGFRIIKVATIREIQLHGRLEKAQGRSVVGPAIAGRSFAAFTLEELQYLFWNTFKATPSDDYSVLIQECLARAQALESDPTDLKELEYSCSKLEVPEGETLDGETKPAKKSRAPKEPKTPKTPKDPSGRPASTSTTGLVWALADECHAKVAGGMIDWKVLGKTIKDRCEKEGINKGTVGVQFGKWKKAKLSA